MADFLKLKRPDGTFQPKKKMALGLTMTIQKMVPPELIVQHVLAIACGRPVSESILIQDGIVKRDKVMLEDGRHVAFSERMRAWEFLADKGFVRPPTIVGHVDVGGEEMRSMMAYDHLTDEQRDQLEKLLAAAAGELPTADRKVIDVGDDGDVQPPDAE